MTKRTRKAKIAFTIFILKIWISFTWSADVAGEFRNCAIIAGIATAIDACVDLFLEDKSVTLALHFYDWLVLLWLLEEVDSCFSQWVHTNLYPQLIYIVIEITIGLMGFSHNFYPWEHKKQFLHILKLFFLTIKDCFKNIIFSFLIS